MARVPMSAPLATRHLRLRCNDGSQSRVTITLGVPVPDPLDPGRTWACPYEIAAFGGVEARAMLGMDGFQALILAIHTLPSELRALARDHGGQFLDQPDLGLDHVCRSSLEFAG